MHECDVVIPAYNEAGRIGTTLQAYVQLPKTIHYIVVLDGCTDATIEVVKTLQLRYPDRIHVIVQKQQKGKGTAVRAGWTTSTAPWVGFVDADNATPPDQFMRIFNAAQRHDGAIGSRLIQGAIIHQSTSPLRRYASRWFAALIRMLFHLPYHDMQCGAKIFRRTSIEPILPLLQENGMNFDIELLWRLQQNGCRITEVPIEWTDQPNSATFHNNRAFVGIGIHMLTRIILLRWRIK